MFYETGLTRLQEGWVKEKEDIYVSVYKQLTNDLLAQDKQNQN